MSGRRGYWLTMVLHRGFIVLLLGLIVWATVTEGPSVGGTIYVLACAGVIEVSWRITRGLWSEAS